ncbi:MAG: hypothetical protein M1445_04115 [Bacteroidetes bacterium]|nr:hypothetical protein [Bacteroidota bacterium]
MDREISRQTFLDFVLAFCQSVVTLSIKRSNAIRLLPTSFLVVAMTDHFFGGECGEKEAGGDSAITKN